MTLDDEIDNLTRIPLFAIFEPSALRTLAFSCETRLLRTGDALFQRGDELDGGYILSMGAISLSPNGGDGAAVHILRPWTLLGETALVAPSLRPATARAMEPTTVMKISRTLFHDVLERHPATAARTRNFFRDRLIDFTRNAGVRLTKDGHGV